MVEASEVDLLSIELLEERGRQLAALLTLARRSRGSARRHLRRLREQGRSLRKVYAALAQDARRESVSRAAEWLLDNYHAISAAARDIHHDLPPSLFRRLPQIATGEFAGLPRVHALASELIRSSGGSLDAQRLHRFITAFQAIAPLTIRELWALRSALRLAIVEQLRERAEVVAQSREHRREADRVAAAFETGTLSAVTFHTELDSAFVTRLLDRSREYGASAAVLRRELDTALALRGQTVQDVIRSESRREAAEETTMANLVGSLRLIAAFDWNDFFESVSLVEQVLQRDPAGVYGRMDFRSRDSYRDAVEELAQPTGEDQLRVALKIVESARVTAAKMPAQVAAHIGYYLIGPGRRAFEKNIAWVTPNQRLRRVVSRYAAPGYLGTIALGTALLMSGAALYAHASGWRGSALTLVAVLTLIPACEMTIQVVQRIAGSLIPPRRLPRLGLEQVPDTARTIVLVRTVLDRVEDVGELLTHLEVQAVGNADPRIHFAVLSDPCDAATETMPRDAEILDSVKRGIEALNSKHGEGRPDRFFLFHRQRLWNESEGRWIPWNGKSGTIEEFNRLLRGAADTSFAVQVGDLSILPQVSYCLALDSDTRLPRDAAKELIGIAAHPLNRAIFDAGLGRVVEGYGVLQPRIGVSDAGAGGSLFARLHAGDSGVDSYTAAVADTDQDVFGEGIFTGEGLYDVDAFSAVLESSAPANVLPSHDLLDGLYARTALVPDVALVEESPSNVLVHLRRDRWTSGACQILFWLFGFVQTRHGRKRNTLPLIAHWNILNTLRRGLVAPALLALAVAGWTVLPGRRWVWTASVVGVFVSQLLPLSARLVVGPRRSQSFPVFLRTLRRDAMTAAAHLFLSVTFLAFQAFDAAHATTVTLIRPVTKRRALGRETAAMASGLDRERAPRQILGEMLSSPIIALVIGTVLIAAYRGALPVAAPFLLLWMGAPFVAYRLSIPVGDRMRPLNDVERMLLRKTARQTWRYFETFVTATDAWLPPDNYQEGDDGSKLARRTSPTDIGMGLLSTLAAHDLGYLRTSALVERLDQSLTTLEGLERYNGHFLNWYDTAR
jgi:cyclic beta-1,2-glucan synthetase